MLRFIRVCKGEMIKQGQNYYNTWQTYISLVLWPIINSIVTYFIYNTFDLSNLEKYGIDSANSLLIFIFTGTLGYNCFWAMVQSALFMQNERENGTMEIILLSPANRLAMVYGRALGGIIQNIWMFIFFVCVIFILNGTLNLVQIMLLVIAFIILVISAVIWGGLVNAIFLISRDTSFWFDIFDSPMELFSGVKVPIAAFPLICRIVSYIYPLTYCLIIIRSIIINQKVEIGNVIALIGILILVILITILILAFAEYRNRKTGNLQMY